MSRTHYYSVFYIDTGGRLVYKRNIMGTLDNNFYRPVADKIREARKSANLTQKMLAGNIGLTRAAVANIESGRQQILLHTLLREQFPLTDKNFTIYIDGIAVTPKYIPGTRFRIREKTEFGSVNGEIIISHRLFKLTVSNAYNMDNLGFSFFNDISISSILASMVTSRAVVGSSAISRPGEIIKPRNITGTS